MAGFFKRVETRMLEMQRHWGTVLGGEDGDKGKLLKA